MKKCPNCEKTFDDDKRFCQIDGTPLVEFVEAAPVVEENPFKTVVIGRQDIPADNLSDDPRKTTVIRGDDDLLQIPEVFDPMKTMVVSDLSKLDKPSDSTSAGDMSPELPKFEEPNIVAPNFGNLPTNQPAPPETPKGQTPVVQAPPPEPPKVEAPKFQTPPEPPKVEAPKFEEPKLAPPPASSFGEPPKVAAPIANPFNAPPPFESPFSAPGKDLPRQEAIPSPFETPKTAPVEPPAFKDPAPAFNPPPSPFQTPSTPSQSVEPAPWNPPPAPVQDWQDKPIGSETPIIPAVGTAGPSSALAYISIGTGVCSLLSIVGMFIPVLGLVCTPLLFIFAITAIITGFLGRGRAKNKPEQYGGGGLAVGGIIAGALSILAFLGIIVAAVIYGMLSTR